MAADMGLTSPDLLATPTPMPPTLVAARQSQEGAKYKRAPDLTQTSCRCSNPVQKGARRGRQLLASLPQDISCSWGVEWMFSLCYTKPNPSSPSQTKSLVLRHICVLHYVKSVRLPACREDGTFGVCWVLREKERENPTRNQSRAHVASQAHQGRCSCMHGEGICTSQCKIPWLAESVPHIPVPRCSQSVC